MSKIYWHTSKLLHACYIDSQLETDFKLICGHGFKPVYCILQRTWVSDCLKFTHKKIKLIIVSSISNRVILYNNVLKELHWKASVTVWNILVVYDLLTMLLYSMTLEIPGNLDPEGLKQIRVIHFDFFFDITLTTDGWLELARYGPFQWTWCKIFV